MMKLGLPAKPVGEDRPPGITKYSATSKSELANPSGEAGHSWAAYGTTSADTVAVAQSVGEARPPEFMKHSATLQNLLMRR